MVYLYHVVYLYHASRNENVAAKADSSLSNRRASLSRSLATGLSVDSRMQRVNLNVRPSIIRGVPPVVIRCVYWTMQRGVLQTWITPQSPAIEMWKAPVLLTTTLLEAPLEFQSVICSWVFRFFGRKFLCFLCITVLKTLVFLRHYHFN